MPRDYTYLDKMDRSKPTIRAKHCKECMRLMPIYCYNNPTDKVCENCLKKYPHKEKFNMNTEPKTMTREEYEAQNINKTTITSEVPYESLMAMLEAMKSDSDPVYEFTAIDENTQEEYLVSLNITRKG